MTNKTEIPEGATHYSEELDQYFILEDGIWFKLVNGSWWQTKSPPFTDIVSL